MPSVPLAVLGDNVLHWRVGDCIPVTYAPAFATSQAALQSALDAWNAALACGGLCLSPAVEAPEPTVFPSRTIRLAVGDPSPFDPGASFAVSNTFRWASGEIVQAEILVSPQATTAPTQADFVYLVGRALGLDKVPADGVESVMKSASPRTLTAPTTNDVEAACTLYGATPLCAR